MFSSKSSPIVYCILGRFGDICVVLPGLKALYDSTGTKPIVVVGKEFANIFDGVSYAQAHPVAFDVYRGVRAAIEFAIYTYGDCIVPKWWDDPRNKPPPRIPPPWFGEETPKVKSGETVSMHYKGQKIVLAKEDWENYMVSQWEHAGFTREQMMEWPLVFDRRNKEAEAVLARQWFKSTKPKLLYNFSGRTSPLPKEHYTPMMQVIHRLAHKFEPVNLGSIKAHHIYDLLGLYDQAAALITVDTATLHLAGASSVPYVALLANGGSGSVPKGNCILKVRYHNAGQKQSQIFEALNSI